MILLLTATALATGLGSSAALPQEYVLEAENSVGEWYTGYWSGEYGRGAYLDEASPYNAISRLAFNITRPGHYLIGCRFSTEENVNYPAPAFTMLAEDEDGNLLHNLYENWPQGFVSRYGFSGGWAAPVIGLWDLPRGNITLVARAPLPRYMVVDYFYLIPLLEVGGNPIAILPFSPWPAEGDWLWGETITSFSMATDRPGASSTLSFKAPVSAPYAIYVTTWHESRTDHRIDFEFNTSTAVNRVHVDQEAGTVYETFYLGTFDFPAGDVSIGFTSHPDNPTDGGVAIERFVFAPIMDPIQDLPVVAGRDRGDPVIDGVNGEWDGLPTIVEDPEGDSFGATDIRELKGFTRDGYLYFMCDFYSLTKHPKGFLEISLDGMGEMDYLIDVSAESGTTAEIQDFALGDGFIANDVLTFTFEVIEMRIPLALIGGQEEFYLRYRITEDDESVWTPIDDTRRVQVAPLGEGLFLLAIPAGMLMALRIAKR
jgi:hypothetical protein